MAAVEKPSDSDLAGRPAVPEELERLLCRLLWLAMRLYVKVLPGGIKMPTPERFLLERLIFRELFLDPKVRAMMFVGVAGYTSWYPTLFRARPGFRFATIDPDPKVEPHGSPGDHRVARFETLLEASEEHGRFDVVFSNVFGQGIDTESQQRVALDAAYALLRPGGRLLIAYTTTNGRRDIDLDTIDRAKFRQVEVPGLGGRSHTVEWNMTHTFVCFARTDSDS